MATSSTIPGKLLGAAILIGAAVGIINWVKDTIVLPDLVGLLLAQNPGLGGLQDQLPQLPQVQLPGVELPALPVVDLSPLAPVGIGIGLLALLGWSYSSCQDAE